MSIKKVKKIFLVTDCKTGWIVYTEHSFSFSGHHYFAKDNCLFCIGCYRTLIIFTCLANAADYSHMTWIQRSTWRKVHGSIARASLLEQGDG